uniref:N(6)-L-threonylcarbamoyladenine synthase n=1 Tax=Piliocolobus tephrosceles TaxID=591936 RepID=A0A8C9HEN6_9PRIM
MIEPIISKNENVKYILGIEGSANKLGVSIINNEKKILINMRRTYISEIGCGFIPREISSHHKHYLIDMIYDCLKKVKIKITDISLICYTKGPGIGSALYIAYNICKIFSLLFNIPVVGVNHCIAHIEMGIFITKLYHPIILYVSGSNTQIIYYNDHKKKYEIIGETLDIAIGNVIDRSARILRISNLPSPGYNARDDTYDYTELLFFPYTIKGMDISFSGYDYYINKINLTDEEKRKIQICYSLQHHIFSMLIEITERAISFTHSNEVIIVGGVGCNMFLQNMMKKMAKQKNIKIGFMDHSYCVDNGAMIAYTGLIEYLSSTNKQNYNFDNISIHQRYRTDDVLVTWR